jgi:hypothetical protein
LTKGIRTSAPKGELDEKGVEKKNDLVYYLFKLTNYLSHFFFLKTLSLDGEVLTGLGVILLLIAGSVRFNESPSLKKPAGSHRNCFINDAWVVE